MKKFIVKIEVLFTDNNKTISYEQEVEKPSEKECDKHATRVAVALAGNRPSQINVNIKRLQDVTASH